MAKKGKIRSKNATFKPKKKSTNLINKDLKKWKPKSKVGRIVLKNLPFKASREDIQKLLLAYGDLREVKLLERPDGSPVGCGFVQFTRKESAEKAIKMCNNLDFMGRKITVDWAVPKAEYILKRAPNDFATTEIHKQSPDNALDISEASESDVPPEADLAEAQNHQLKKKIKKKNKSYDLHTKNMSNSTVKSQQYSPKIEQDEAGNFITNTEGFKQEHESLDTKKDVSNTTDEIKNENSESFKKEKKERKMEKRPKKKGRLIVRNLSFKITEDILREHFSKYGDITEINLLKRPDGKLVGCAFIQFERVQSAAKAILGSSGKPLIGRTVVIDWAVPHTKYVEATKNEKDMTIKEEDESKADIKSEISSQASIKDESDSESGFESDKVVKEESTSNDSSKVIKAENSSDESEDDELITEDEQMEPTKEKLRKPRIVSNDVTEGCTVFVKNVPFSATNEELKSCMEQFGPVVYALICIDPLTEHSKGTAFVKFKEKENAEECLKAGTELTLNNQTLDVFRALSRDEIGQKMNRNKDSDKKKDSRNLYLVKEGVVMAGTPAADGVSVADMSRRLQLEKWKSQILRNLNMFVSPTRLIVHNVPPSWTDSQLRKLFQDHSGQGAIITEARIMRNMKDINADGTGKSKEYGFVSFSTHEAALQALRNINNNPKIFTLSKRPIVSFSIENKAILKAKQQRLERSRTNNHPGRNPPKTDWKSNHVNMEAVQQHESKKQKRKRKNVEMRAKKKLKKESNAAHNNETETNEYVGIISKPGNVKLPTKFALKKQATLHVKHVKQSKKKEKLKQRRLKQHISQEPIKQPKQKQNSRRKHKEEDKTLNKLINAYKSKLNSASDFKKWYE
ncbi:RNA-binding protein 28 [Schistocerca americana]|uniref:RNA-binding protein 28 n=1 Tax=Schistocerca americana TaxID=7009 RepID=UPI001F4F8839|nr:RNA-binding protein 28 [Schistocerca americana]